MNVAAITTLMALALLLSATGTPANAGVQVDALEFEAARGDPAAQTELAVLYEHSEGIDRDLGRAGALYCEAARHGYADAQFRLGWIYANGRGVARNDAVAAALFQRAAALGHPGAAKLLAYIPAQPDTELPQCMRADPPFEFAQDDAAAEAAAQKAIPDALSALEERTPIERLVYSIAPRYAVDPELALAMIEVESNFNPIAVSPKNAQGLMQLIPETAQRFGVKRVFDPVENVNGGLAYIRWLLAFFQGDVTLVIAAYNAGEGAVERYRGVPPYAETRKYVKKIMGMYTKARHPYEARLVEPSAIVIRGRRAKG